METAQTEQGQPLTGITRLKRLYANYERLGTLKAAGEVEGVTRQRAHQLLRLGTDLGLFRYDPRRRSERIRQAASQIRTPDRLASLAAEIGGLNKAIGALGAAPSMTQPILRILGTTEEAAVSRIREARRQARVNRCVVEYLAIAQVLGRKPTSNDLQHSGQKGWRATYARILRQIGGMAKFQEELARRGLELPPGSNMPEKA